MSISTRFYFLGIPGEVFFKFDAGEDVNICYWWEVRFEPTTPKAMVLPTTLFVKELECIANSPFDHW